MCISVICITFTPEFDMMIQTDNALFVCDEDNSSDLIEKYKTDVNLETLVIRVDDTSCSKYYQLFREWKEKKRVVRQRLFVTTQMRKMIDYINTYLKRDKA